MSQHHSHSHSHEVEHKSSVNTTAHHIASELHDNAAHHDAGKTSHQHILSELTKLRTEDAKSFGAKGDEHFKKDLKDINQYLKSQHLDTLDFGAKDFENKVVSAAKDANKSHDFSNVYGFLDSHKAADEAKYGKDLGDFMFNQELSQINGDLQKNHLPALSIEDKGNGNFAVEQSQSHGPAHEISNSADTAQAIHNTSVHHHWRHASSGRATSALSNYLRSGGQGGGDGTEDLDPNANLDGGNVAQSNEIMNSLISKYGLTPAGAAACVGNMMQENSLSTAANSGGVGLCQWIGSRAKEEMAFAKQQGLSPTSVQAQVGFMVHELQRDYPSLLHQLKTTNDAAGAALAFSQQFERPGNPQNGKRQGYAKSALNEFQSSANKLA